MEEARLDPIAVGRELGALADVPLDVEAEGLGIPDEAQAAAVVVGAVLLLYSGNFEASGDNVTLNFNISAIFISIIFLFILSLELKDKLLAKTELQEGKAIQQSLIPEQSPKVDGWDIWLYTRSANNVGGDLLDFIKIEENKFGVAVGDVAGKGLSAALLIAKLQSTIRAIIYDQLPLNKMCQKLNSNFYRDSPSKIFASLIYLEIQSDSNEIKMIDAGHYPPAPTNPIGQRRRTQLERSHLLQKNRCFTPSLIGQQPHGLKRRG